VEQLVDMGFARDQVPNLSQPFRLRSWRASVLICTGGSCMQEAGGCLVWLTFVAFSEK